MSETRPHAGFFDWQVQRALEQDPALVCPVLLARKVLTNMGITTMAESTFKQFSADLKEHNFYTVITDEREVV